MKAKIGDVVHFSTISRVGKTTTKRKIIAINENGVIGVRLFGWNPYWLYSVGRLDKIIKIEKKKNDK